MLGLGNARIVALCAALLTAGSAHAQDTSADAGYETARPWNSGWYLTLGASVMTAPKFAGSNSNAFFAAPIVSLGRYGNEARFVSRNDNIALALIDQQSFRVGASGKFIWGRDSDDYDQLRGLSDVKFGGEIGAFVDVYPTDWMRIRADVRHGVRSHNGVVADINADAFLDVVPRVRVSAGPRLTFATANYFDAYYGVSAAESRASGLAAYDPGGGVESAGFGGAISWNVTDRLTASTFAEYKRLLGPAADSSIVTQRGARDQWTLGVSSTYRFDLTR
jgi:outer membrane scaffolding protein for murein synthesis (MipA/OmpV family)